MYLTCVETISRSCCLPLFLFPSKEAMISPFCIVKLHPVQKCSGKTAVALWAGEYLMFPGLGFSLSVFGRGITVNNPGLKTLAVSFLPCCTEDLWLEYWRLWLGFRLFHQGLQGDLDTACAPCFAILAILFCWCNPRALSWPKSKPDLRSLVPYDYWNDPTLANVKYLFHNEQHGQNIFSKSPIVPYLLLAGLRVQL